MTAICASVTIKQEREEAGARRRGSAKEREKKVLESKGAETERSGSATERERHGAGAPRSGSATEQER